MRVIGLLLAAVLLACCGCGGMQRFDAAVKVNGLADAGGTFPPVRVHIVGVQDGDELERYRQYPVDQWFAPDNELRRGAMSQGIVRELSFLPGQESTLTFSRKDPIWKAWKGRSAAHLVIMANRQAPAKQEAGMDPRRLVLPLSTDRWDNPDEVTIDVQQGGITATPGPRPAD